MSRLSEEEESQGRLSEEAEEEVQSAFRRASDRAWPPSEVPHLSATT